MQPKDDELITVADLMKMLKISRPTAYRYVEQKKFKIYRIGKMLRISKDSVSKYLENNSL